MPVTCSKCNFSTLIPEFKAGARCIAGSKMSEHSFPCDGIWMEWNV